MRRAHADGAEDAVKHLRSLVHATGIEELFGGGAPELDDLLGGRPLGRREVSARGFLVPPREL